MKVLICDDLPEENIEFEKAIMDAHQPCIVTKRLCNNDLKEQLNTLIQNADKVLSKNIFPSDLPTTEFDNKVDLVILDNNLAQLDIQGTRLTAESIAGYIRAFSSASYIVSINKNPQIDFDLRYLIGDYATRADLALNTHHLSNPALWTKRRTEAHNGFLPWYWPKLLDVGINRSEKIQFIKKHLDGNICKSLGISTNDYISLSRQARSLLSQAEETRVAKLSVEKTSGMTATFREIFLCSSRSLPNEQERKNLSRESESHRDVQEIMARVVAADIDYWFRRDVLGPQEFLVDIPHLLMRMPFLLGDGADDIEWWNASLDTAMSDPTHCLDHALFSTHLESARFEHEILGTQPYFIWSKLRDDEKLNANFSTKSIKWADTVFCEDRSEFLPVDPEKGLSQPREFVAQFEGSWNRRYVAEIEGVRYVPKTRFAQ